jgi:hypothetical protein
MCVCNRKSYIVNYSGSKFATFTSRAWLFMKVNPYFVLLMCWCGFIAGQQVSREQQIDSLKAKLNKDSAWIYRKTIARPYLRLENRRSFIVDERVNFLGVQGGAVLYDRHIISAGYYFLDKRSKEAISSLDNSDGAIRQFSKLSYYVFSYQYILFNKRFVQLNTPIEIGYGTYGGAFLDSAQTVSGNFDGTFVPAGAGLQLILKPVRWAGVSGSGGYRYVKQDAIRVRFNGWYYSFGVWIDARYLLREFRYYIQKRSYRRNVRELSKQGNWGQ